MKIITVMLIFMLMVATIFPIIGAKDFNYDSCSINSSYESIAKAETRNIELNNGGSVTNTDNLIFNNILDEVIDQEVSDNIGYGFSFYNMRPRAQSFVPSLDSITKVEIPFFAIGDPADGSIITMSIKDDLESVYSLASMSIDADQINNLIWIEFDIDDIAVVPGEQYFIVCESTTENPENNYYCWLMSSPGANYREGDPWYYMSGGWYKTSMDPAKRWDHCFRTYGFLEDNVPPEKPSIPIGPDQGNLKVNYTFTTSTTDQENDMIYYLWDWGDGRNSDWIGPYDSGETCEITNMWHLKGTYEIRVKAKDRWGYESDWSDPLIVSMPRTRDSNLLMLFHKNPWLMNPLKNILTNFNTNTKSTTDDTEYWGLLIAVGEYLNNPEENRPNMLTEVENLYDALIKSEIWDPSHIRKIKAENANLENILEGFSWLMKMEDQNDISLIYITTHGYYLDQDLPPIDEADGKDEFLIPYEGFDDTSKILWDDEINFFCSLMQSKGICLIVDSCFSGGFNDAYQRSIGEIRSEDWINDFVEDLSSNTGRVILMSSEEDEVSYGSTFSRYIAKGLDGSADDNDDHIISAEELFFYAEPFVTQSGRQQPTLVDTYTGELPMVLMADS